MPKALITSAKHNHQLTSECFKQKAGNVIIHCIFHTQIDNMHLNLVERLLLNYTCSVFFTVHFARQQLDSQAVEFRLSWC